MAIPLCQCTCINPGCDILRPAQNGQWYALQITCSNAYFGRNFFLFWFKFQQSLNQTTTIFIQEMNFKMLSSKRVPFCLSLSVVRVYRELNTKRMLPPLLTHWSYVFFALSYRYLDELTMCAMSEHFLGCSVSTSWHLSCFWWQSPHLKVAESSLSLITG